MNRTTWILVGGLFCISLYLVYLLSDKIDDNKEILRLLDSMESEMINYKDSDSLNNSKIRILETSNKDFFIKLQAKDSTIKELQELVGKYKKFMGSRGSATIVKNETTFSMKSPTVIRDTIRDTIKRYLYPVYESELNGGKWAKGRFYADKDTTLFDIKFINEYEIVQGEEKQGWFKPSIPVLNITNRNPYTETTDVKTYRVYIKPKRWGVGPNASLSLTSERKLVPSIGAGIQYNIIQF